MTLNELLEEIQVIRRCLAALKQNRQVVKEQNNRRIREGERASDILTQDEAGFREYQTFKEQYRRELKMIRNELEGLEKEETD